MSLQSSLTALASAVRSKSGTDETLTIDEMTEKVNGIFPAFYSGYVPTVPQGTLY